MTARGQDRPGARPYLFLLFEKDRRPAAAQIRAAVEAANLGMVSHDPTSRAPGPEQEGGGPVSHWLEVLVSGLSFDIRGLEPGPSLAPPATRHRFGDADVASLRKSEAIGIAPGPHLAGAAGSIPVLRALLQLGAGLVAQLDAVTAVVWQPAASAMGPRLFIHAIGGWLENGAFPALGLMGAVANPQGELVSDGLGFFIGQELVLDASLATDRIAGTRLLLRLVDRLVADGSLADVAIVGLAGGDSLRLVPESSTIRVLPA